MKKQIRKIIQIDEERCDGCGLCVLDCAEGAIAIIDGKAKLVKDSYCDGLGACLGACPQDALHIIEREADEFDEEAAMEHVRRRDAATGQPPQPVRPHHSGGCPGSMVRSFGATGQQSPQLAQAHQPAAGPGHWPLKIRLVPPTAPFLKGADVLVAADCAAAASPQFHSRFAAGKVVLIGCPKFDDTAAYAQRLADILTTSGIASLTVLRMEVPCCRGLSEAVNSAVRQSGSSVQINEVIMTCQGHEAQNTLFG
ncbi:ATP-binding protein [Oleidesulfovibrio alaskensis]|jgi:NAD-dependent dihydropyrimidine dehydrogenase PreA subunit|nr:4Fe-4S binding protein [Oleidesulfovibrio alaskensis]MBG0772485.1 4Fe-4S binding protein [Oleidesulfovibrio alaskensis]MBL3582153.1 4Fe-4S binding protein [Oleidesulfovibrio alaskensis]